MTKYRLREMIDSLEFDEMVKMKKDLDSGGIYLKRFLESKIRESEKEHEQFCSSCSSPLKSENINNFTIVFGPDDFRKKASFCGMDCLEYFLNELKEIKRVKNE